MGQVDRPPVRLLKRIVLKPCKRPFDSRSEALLCEENVNVNDKLGDTNQAFNPIDVGRNTLDQKDSFFENLVTSRTFLCCMDRGYDAQDIGAICDIRDGASFGN